jgi:hypothetical protein
LCTERARGGGRLGGRERERERGPEGERDREWKKERGYSNLKVAVPLDFQVTGKLYPVGESESDRIFGPTPEHWARTEPKASLRVEGTGLGFGRLETCI